MTNELFYIQKVEKLQRENEKIFSEISSITKNDYSILSRSNDEVSSVDIAFMLIFGIIGATISNNEKLKEVLDDIHSDASLKKPKTFLGKILHHRGDGIDHITRGGKPFATYLHRLYGGHDPFSLNTDNPFYVLVKQYGIPKGILQALRHLIADPFSKNGGVLPLSSFLDFTKEDGSVGNYIDEWSKAVAKGSGMNPQQVYSELFSIKAQDVCSTMVTVVLVKLYTTSRNIIDNDIIHKYNETPENKYFSKIAISQLTLIALLSNVIGSVALGMVKNKDVPKINYPVAGALILEIFKFFRLNYADLKYIEKRTEKLEKEISIIEKQIFLRGNKLPTYKTCNGYIKEIENEYSSYIGYTNIKEELE
jgi:hypothetical protein